MALSRFIWSVVGWCGMEAISLSMCILQPTWHLGDAVAGLSSRVAFAQSDDSDWTTIRLLIPCWDTAFAHRQFVVDEYARRTKVEIHDDCGGRRLRFLPEDDGVVEVVNYTRRSDQIRRVVAIADWETCTPPALDSGGTHSRFCVAAIDAQSGQELYMREWTPAPGATSATEGFVAVREWFTFDNDDVSRFEIWQSESVVCYLDGDVRLTELSCVDLQTSERSRTPVGSDACLTRMWYSQESGLCWYNDVGYRVGRYPDRTRPTRHP